MNRIERREAAKLNIGRRCRWLDEAHGTIIDVVVVGGGNSCYVVDWADAPAHYSRRVSTAHGPDFVIEAP